MKRKIFSSYFIAAMISIAAASFITSCEKDTDGSPDIKAGSMQFTEITPGEAPGGTVLTLKGSGLGQIRSVVFEKNNVPASFSPNLNTDNAVLFRVPDTAFGGQQNIVFTNSAGTQMKVPFKVIALPAVNAAFPTDFKAGSTITLTGNNLDDVTKVILEGTTDQATIVSKSRKEMVITMPASNVSTAKLKLTNSSGDRITEDITFVNMDKQYLVFGDAFGSDFQDWSWGSDRAVVTTNSVMGSAWEVKYTGDWGGVQMKAPAGFSIAPYSKIGFWILNKGAERKLNFNLNWQETEELTIPANRWTYFVRDLTKFKNKGVSNVTEIIFQLNGNAPAGPFYFDNVMFIK